MKDRLNCGVVLLCVLVMSFAAFAETVVEWDFTKGVHGWTNDNSIFLRPEKYPIDKIEKQGR